MTYVEGGEILSRAFARPTWCTTTMNKYAHILLLMALFYDDLSPDE